MLPELLVTALMAVYDKPWCRYPWGL